MFTKCAIDYGISPVLVRYDVTEPTSVEIALDGLKFLAGQTAAAKMTDTPLRKPIFNQTQFQERELGHILFAACPYTLLMLTPLRSVTMAQCTCAFVKGENMVLAKLARALKQLLLEDS